MLDALWLRFDAPLMSFGSSIVDHLGRTQEFPGLSLLVGLVGNALGYDHSQPDRLQALQSRLVYAVRQDRGGEVLTDFHTVDLGQESLVGTGWTTQGRVEERGKGEATSGTHIRYRDYLADSVYTVALTLREANTAPTLDTIERALREPARPLFIGRKTCLPAAPILLGRTRAATLVEALRAAPLLASPRGSGAEVMAWWPPLEADCPSSVLVPVTDERDWVNQIHGGQRHVRQGRLKIGGTADAV